MTETIAPTKSVEVENTETENYCPNCNKRVKIDECGAFFAEREYYVTANEMPEIWEKRRDAYEALIQNSTYKIPISVPGAYVSKNEGKFNIHNNIMTCEVPINPNVPNSRPAFSHTPVCNYCGFTFPQNFFKSKKIYISLMGARHAGKTVFLNCLKRFDWRCLNYNSCIKFRDIEDASYHSHSQFHNEISQKLEQNPAILPSPTPVDERVPPLFVNLEVKLNGSSEEYIVAFIDFSGENFPKGTGISELSYCDAFILLAQPGEIWRTRMTFSNITKNKEYISIATKEEQMSMGGSTGLHSGNNSSTVVDYDYLGENNPKSKNSSSAVNINEIANKLPVLIKGDKSKDVAVVIAKSDTITNSLDMGLFNYSFSKKINRNFLNDSFIYDFNTIALKNQILQRVLEDKLHIRKRVMYNYCYFCVSALGKEPESADKCNNIDSKNIDEPIMWVILNKLRKMGVIRHNG